MSENLFARSKTRNGNQALAGKTVVKLFTQDGVRELLIPSNEPNYHPVVLSYDRLKQLESKAVKKESIDVAKERKRLLEASQKRKERFQQLDAQAKRKSAKLTELEQEAKEKANYLLRRAWELRMEQEDDVKAANSLILKTKCQAIRDAQLAEQALIKKKLQEDEMRMERAMEEERLVKVIEEKRMLEKQRDKQNHYVKELSKQLGEIHSRRIGEFERTIQERQHLNEAMNMMMLEEARKLREADAAKARTRQELAVVNEQIQRIHMMEKEEARLADLKVQEWMRKRAEREEALEREQAEAKRRKELETARLRAMQEKAGELQAQQDHMMAVRRFEEYEREWRRKEKEAVEKKKKMNALMMDVRDKQVNEIRKIQAAEIARERKEHERIMNQIREADEKEEAAKLERQHAVQAHRETLLRQMNEKEVLVIQQRRNELDEGVAMRAEAAKREDEIRRVYRDKIAQMRQHKVPEMYIVDVMRQLHLN